MIIVFIQYNISFCGQGEENIFLNDGLWMVATLSTELLFSFVSSCSTFPGLFLLGKEGSIVGCSSVLMTVLVH